MPSISAQEEEVSPNRHSYDGGSQNTPYGYQTPQNDNGWWGSANGYSGGGSPNYGAQSMTPQYGSTPMYSPVTEGQFVNDSQDGLLSPMNFNNTNASSFASSSQSRLGTHVNTPATIEEEDDDELGLGNTSTKRMKGKERAQEDQQMQEKPAEPVKEEPDDAAKDKKKEADKTLKSSASSSWLGRIFKRDANSPGATGSGPIKAKLGEETSFVYDPVEKRWVNKKAGADTPPPTVVAPPPRAQTASPSAQSQPHINPSPLSKSLGPSSGAPPPPRTAANTPPLPASLSATPPISRPASAGGDSLPPPRPSSTANGELPPPPAKRTGGAAGKKGRPRYVDVFAQPQ